MPSVRSGLVFVFGVFVAAAVLVAGLARPTAAGPHHDHNAVTDPHPPAVAFEQAMRVLWEDDITWTRLFIVDATAQAPETDATTQRLLKNQVDIGDAIKPFYGEEAGARLTELLTQHILGAADVLAAAMAGDTAKLDAARRAWYANGDEIAAFLSTANPTCWPLDEMKAMLKDHLDQTLAEAVAHLNGDWAADVAAYNAVHRHILGMADMLSAGIVAQFPEQFASSSR
ncbi:MAG TPA: hypothetical protein VKB09_12415 [Thermomicrobiales bacterium]|nr:hypothetical protein [Thermomicrobiales bacterium]